MKQSSTFFLNLGNNRTNIKWVVQPMRYPVDEFKDIDFVIGQTNRHEDNRIKKTLIFCNEIHTTHHIMDHLRSLLPEDEKDSVQPYHAQRSQLSKDLVMEQFISRRVEVLVATEAAGMVSLFQNTKLSNQNYFYRV